MNLWNEFEEQKTNEAKFVKALDKIEVRIQHNESPIERWNDIEFPRSQFVADKYCEYDSALREFNQIIKDESKKKIVSAGKDFEEVLRDAKKLSSK